MHFSSHRNLSGLRWVYLSGVSGASGADIIENLHPRAIEFMELLAPPAPKNCGCRQEIDTQ